MAFFITPVMLSAALIVKIKYMHDELKKYKDPKKLKDVLKDLKRQFLDSLPNIEIKPIIKRTQKTEWHIGFVGKTSAGKSSLLNKLFKLKLKTSLGKCTNQPQKVKTIKNLHIWDLPGIDDVYSQNAEALTFLNSLDSVCILYDGQISDIADIAQILWVLNKETIFLRTKCDNADENQEYSVQEQIQRDINNLKELQKCPKKLYVFATSKKGQFDNQKLLSKIMTYY